MLTLAGLVSTNPSILLLSVPEVGPNSIGPRKGAVGVGSIEVGDGGMSVAGTSVGFTVDTAPCVTVLGT